MISWAGVFGSVSRDMQRPDSDVDILVGYSKDADFWRDVCGSINGLIDNLSEVLGRKTDVVPYMQNREMAYVHMEALLTAKTIWGDASWFMTSRDSAESILRLGYVRTKKAREMLSYVQETVLSFKVRDLSVTQQGYIVVPSLIYHNRKNGCPPNTRLFTHLSLMTL